MSELLIDREDIEEAWLVSFGDAEGWHPSLAAGLFFSYKDAAAFVEQTKAATDSGLFEYTILRVLPFKLEVVNDFTDPENPPRPGSER